VSETALADWLAGLTPAGDALPLVWGEAHRLERRLYATLEAPPDVLVSSVRAVVFRKGAVVVIRDHDGSSHIMPGGRREAGESQEDALAREIGEETGWRFGAAGPFGFLHFRHLTPKPEGYAYPYPDFFQTLYVVEATDHERRRIVRDNWETHSRMTPIARASQMITDDQKPILRLAGAARRP
jgi:8-oxo-dGTP pyrophosphatase MutT (NUDIX family)